MLIMTMKRLQMNLKFLGYYGGEIDGKKGTMTKTAIRKFRIDNGLGDSEIADQKTIDTIRNIICDIQRQVGATVDGVAGNETKTKKEEYDKQAKTYTWEDVKHFQKSEFTCKCGCESNNMNLEVVKVADEIREHFGKPAIVNSGYRCTKHNKNVGGVSNSRHLKGKAIDLYVSGVSGQTLLSYTRKLVNQGKLRYTYFIAGDAVHIDIE